MILQKFSSIKRYMTTGLWGNQTPIIYGVPKRRDQPPPFQVIVVHVQRLPEPTPTS